MKKAKKLIFILLSIPVGIFIFVTVALFIVHKARGLDFSYENNGSDLTFMSSDGVWYDEENMLSGKSFEDVVLSFELYRYTCNKPTVTLMRTKDKKAIWQWAWWFDNYDSPKWKIPYIPAEKIVRTDTATCSQRELTAGELRLMENRVIEFIGNLSNTSKHDR